MRRPGAALVSLLSVLSSVVLVTAATAGPRPTERHDHPATPVGWSGFGYDLERTGYNPDEVVLAPDTVKGLKAAWATPLRAATVAQPVEAVAVNVGGVPRNIVYIGDEAGYATAIDAASGSVVWQKYVGSVPSTDGCGGPYGVDGTAAIDRGTNRVYFPGGDDRVYALDLATGARVPGWPVRVSSNLQHEHLWSALTLFQGILYVPVASYCDVPPYSGRVVQIDTTAAKRLHTFWVTGKGSGVSGGGVWGMGGVAIDGSKGNVFTATGNALADPEYYLYAEHVVRLTLSLKVRAADYPGLQGDDVDFGATPMLYHAPGCPAQLAVKNKSGLLFVYRRGAIEAGPTQRIQMASPLDGGFQNLPAYDPATNMVYVSNSSDSADGSYTHGMVAMAVQPDCSLAPAWQQPLGPLDDVVPPPTVANGVVYFGLAGNSAVVALDAITGTPLWKSGSDIQGAVYGAPMVVNGQLFVGAMDGKLYAFGL